MIVAQSGLPIQIVYANVTAAVEYATASAKPLLTYAWEPDHFIVTSGPFIRIAMTEYAYCDTTLLSPGSAAAASRQRDRRFRMHRRELDTSAEPIGSVQACDFPFQGVEKASSRRVELLSDVNIFVSRFNLTHDQIMDLLPQTAEEAELGDPWLYACEWAREHPDQVASWLVHREPRGDAVARA